MEDSTPCQIRQNSPSQRPCKKHEYIHVKVLQADYLSFLLVVVEGGGLLLEPLPPAEHVQLHGVQLSLLHQPGSHGGHRGVPFPAMLLPQVVLDHLAPRCHSVGADYVPIEWLMPGEYMAV